MKRLLIFCVLNCALLGLLQAQPGRDETLAVSYFKNGEYDKAAELYQNLWEKNDYNNQYYNSLYKCLLSLHKYDDLEKVVKKQIKKREGQPQYLIDLGYLYTQIPDLSKAKLQFDKAVKELKPNEIAIKSMADMFGVYQLYDYVIAVYEKGNKLMPGGAYFDLELASAYVKDGDISNGVKYYIAYLEAYPLNAQALKNNIQSSTEENKILSELETQLYGKIQRAPNHDEYVDFLTWIYIQNKDFEGALTQMIALDKRKNENGYRILNIAEMAREEGDYDAAISGYQYVVNKGKQSDLYFMARTALLNCRKEKIANNINYTQDDLLGLKNDYLIFINDNGRSFRTAQSMKELADLEGLYLHEMDSAESLCQQVINMPGVNQKLRNETKLSLGDFYLIDGKVWESTLLYSQVDKDEKDSPLGEEARFRNAKLAYYRGDFDWAQTQLEALKGSTSELISNDAINLSVFIIDNLGLDTSATAMQMYARAELLIFQNKDNDAIHTLDSILRLFPGHALSDDIEYTKAQIFVKHKEFEKAIPLLEDIMTNYKTDLKADDAIFLLAQINQDYLHNKEKAMALYKKIITDYDSSLLVIEARKRYRLLRGDKVTD